MIPKDIFDLPDRYLTASLGLRSGKDDSCMADKRQISYMSWGLFSTIEDSVDPDRKFKWSWVYGGSLEKVDRYILEDLVYEPHTVGKWVWSDVQTDLPAKNVRIVSSAFSSLSKHTEEFSSLESNTWKGIIKLQNTETNEFIYIASVHNSQYWDYFGFSTNDEAQLRRILDDLKKELITDLGTHVLVDFYDGEDVYLPVNQKDNIILDMKLYDDIMLQVHAFYKNKSVYTKLGVPYKRGMLFTGSPGNGKTLMIRHIIKECYKHYKVDATVIGTGGRKFAEEDFSNALSTLRTRNKNNPGILVIEDMDTLLSETGMTRAGFLSVLDGIAPTEGVLMIGSTNNPEMIDPALLHRPARFDRVYHFELPDDYLRDRYVRELFYDVPDAVIQEIVNSTVGWSFAYMNELRVCSAFISIEKGMDKVDSESIVKALDMLTTQFKTTKNPAKLVDEKTERVGFY